MSPPAAPLVEDTLPVTFVLFMVTVSRPRPMTPPTNEPETLGYQAALG